MVFLLESIPGFIQIDWVLLHYLHPWFVFHCFIYSFRFHLRHQSLNFFIRFIENEILRIISNMSPWFWNIWYVSWRSWLYFCSSWLQYEYSNWYLQYFPLFWGGFIVSSAPLNSCILGLVSSNTTWTYFSTLKILLFNTRKALVRGAYPKKIA